uniref:Hemoglobin beta embryonic-3 n=1 Tax=Sinocyclocheilus anshuiensis TaxID=1608454 RepID=A0A671LQN0_9TELE
MVEWTAEERAAIQVYLQNSTTNRCLVVYPWTWRYFGGFGNLYNSEAIMANPKVAAHGTVNSYASLSDSGYHAAYNVGAVLYFSQLLFQLLGDCLTVVIATRMRTEFTPDIQAAWQKFLSVVVSALRRQYH